jgi:hypothetical protein
MEPISEVNPFGFIQSLAWMQNNYQIN